MINIRLLTAFSAMLCLPLGVRAQHTDWIVDYWQGATGKLISVSQCKLISVTNDSLVVESNGAISSVRLFLLYQISRPVENRIFEKPIWMGAVIGGVVGFISTTITMRSEDVRGPNENDPRLAVTAFFTLVGGGLGLAESLGFHGNRYRFGEITNNEKRTALLAIMEEEKKHFSKETGEHVDVEQ
jgi:hypothetical protein